MPNLSSHRTANADWGVGGSKVVTEDVPSNRQVSQRSINPGSP